MSILDKHPAPWQSVGVGHLFDFIKIVDAQGEMVCMLPERPVEADATRETVRELLRIPELCKERDELLAVVQKFLKGTAMIPMGPLGNESRSEAKALVARIEVGK